MTTYQEHLEQLEAKGEEVRQLQDALLIAEGSLKQLTLQSVKTVKFAINLHEQITTLTAERNAAANLLAVIHRDGGHHTGSVGFSRSCADAEAAVLQDRTERDKLAARLEALPRIYAALEVQP